ncbi:MAG: divergent polysaccharide deacetylase family protein, partial [Parvularculaceae bacterium]|nr:divergent polysaccharide deacetylase family protein [Parvularculaceae bacterium]
ADSAFHAPDALRDVEPADLRARHVERILLGGAPSERLATPQGRPKIIIIVDDLGLDPGQLDRVLGLPGPLSLSFLPYARDVAAEAARARGSGHAVMLHLPMEPEGGADAGPMHLSADMNASTLVSRLQRNLGRFDGYVAVNNHMGSRFTRDEAAMKTVLAALKERGVFFVDSRTTPASRAAVAGKAVGVDVFGRDVFVDPESGEDVVRAQLAQVERIARATGYAVAICHPRADTLAVLGPWLTTAPARGFELATVEALSGLARAPSRLAMRP